MAPTKNLKCARARNNFSDYREFMRRVPNPTKMPDDGI